MIVKYKYRSEYGTQGWFIADQSDIVNIFKYESVTWMLAVRMDTGEAKFWNSAHRKWSRISRNSPLIHFINDYEHDKKPYHFDIDCF